MGEVNLDALNSTLCKGLRMVVAIRRLAKDVNLDGERLADLEREVRERAGEIQKALQSQIEDGNSPILRF